MHLKSVITATILGSSVTAAHPSPLDRRDELPNPLELGCIFVQDAEKSMCNSTKTPEMWKTLGIGEWLQGVTIGEHPFKQGLYKTIRDRNLRLHDVKCGDTISPDGLVPFGDCDDITDEETCLCQPYAFFAIKAMHNFVDYMEKLRLTIAIAGTTVGYQIMSMPGIYNPDGAVDNSDDIGLAGGLLGILGTLAGAVPPLSDLGIGFGLVSGILGMVGNEKDAEDPIAPIAEISSHLGHQVEAMLRAVATYTNHVLYDIPPDTKDEDGYYTVYTDDPEEMVAVLGTQGAWVDEPGPIDGTMIKRSLAAPAINALWNRAFVMVAKVSNKDNILGEDPCSGENVFGTDWKHCDGDGNMYVLRKWKGEGGGSWDSTEWMDVPGWQNATEEYGLNTKTIAISSEANQAGSGKFMAPPPPPSDLSSHFLEKDFGHLNDGDMVYFNLPVCDINNAPEMLTDIAYKKCTTSVCKFNILMLCRCAGIVFDGARYDKYKNNRLNDVKFPYDVYLRVCDGKVGF